MSSLPAPPAPRGLICLRIATGAYLLAGLATMLLLSPRTLYADPWRFTGHFLTTPWPWKVLAADNGHREVFPNLVRVFELQWLQANQWLQIGVGAGLALATIAVLLRGIGREPVLPSHRAAAALIAVLGVFWLGNERSLAHGNESVHAYLVTLCLAAGCWLASDPTADRAHARAGWLVLLGTVAAFSFGSGIACFAAFALVLLLRRAPWPQIAIVAAGALIVAGLHLGLGDGGMSSAGVPTLSALLRWVSAPFVYAAWPLLDSSVAAQIPFAPLRSACQWAAAVFENAFGPVRVAIWPNALLGATGVAWLLKSTRVEWRHPQPSRMRQVGLGMAWFGLLVGALVCTSRADYFLQYPAQVVAPRYLPWSSLFWSGLALCSALRIRPERQGRPIAWALVLALVLIPSQAWMAMLAYRTQVLAEYTAVGVAVGVLAADTELGENVPQEISTAVPPLRRAQAAMFAWPESKAIGRPLPTGAAAVAVDGLKLQPVGNLLGAPGYALSFQLTDSPCRRLLLADASGTAVGMAIRSGGSGQWRGWARRAGASPQVYSLCTSEG